MADLKDRFAEVTDRQDTRIVVVQTTGPNAGLHTIGGMTSELREHNGGELPELMPNVPLSTATKPISFGLIKVTPRYTLYRELCGPKALKRFNENQR